MNTGKSCLWMLLVLVLLRFSEALARFEKELNQYRLF